MLEFTSRVLEIFVMTRACKFQWHDSVFLVLYKQIQTSFLPLPNKQGVGFIIRTPGRSLTRRILQISDNIYTEKKTEPSVGLRHASASYRVHSTAVILSLIQAIWEENIFLGTASLSDCLCDLVVSVPVYGSRGPGSIPGYQIFWEVVGLERGPLSLVSTIEELTEWYV
jgi:hypothetical protein